MPYDKASSPCLKEKSEMDEASNQTSTNLKAHNKVKRHCAYTNNLQKFIIVCDLVKELMATDLIAVHL